MIKQDPMNFRFHSERNKEMIHKSLEECGAGRSILIDNDDTAIAGNGVLEQAQELGIPIRIIESDGSELIAIKRTDLSSDDPKRKMLALADNATTDSSDWDTTVLRDHWGEEELEEWDVNLPVFQDYSEKNQEIDTDSLEDKTTITLSYTLEDYHKVKEALSRVAASPEAAVWTLLRLDDYDE